MGGRVLVVDDDSDLREAIVDLLLDDGYDVVSAKDGRDGLLEARSRPPQSIVMDLSMPTMDGRAFRRELLADAALASVPVIVVSADPDGRLTAAKLRANAFVAKPFQPQTLLSALRSTCGIGHA